MPDFGIAEAKTAIEIIKLAQRQGWLDRLVTALRKKHRILVLGNSGAGKTAFLDSLTNSIPATVDRMNRTQFAQKHAVRIAKSPFIFVDTPGQKLHGSRRIKAIREALKEPLSGVINVVSYGYNEGGTPKETAVQGNIVNPAFLETQRSSEIEALGEWSAILGGTDAAGWLITLVTKADLWWDQRDAVIAYYASGPYAEALGPARELRPVVLEYCSVFQKFYGEAPMSGSLQDSDRIRMRGHLLGQLLAAVGKRKS